MGRAIRRVPPNWQHPKRDPKDGEYRRGTLQPMRDQRFDDVKRDWIDGLMQWEDGTHPSRVNFPDCEWWDYSGNPPDRQYYRPWRDEEATWFQLWETVSEGTPVSPPFATKEELAEHLAQHGDGGWGASWPGGWGRDQAYAFVRGDGWTPSFVVQDGNVMSGVEFVTRDRANG